MNSKSNYKKQAERNLERAVAQGQMTVSDYYTKKAEVQTSNVGGVDDGHSCTKGDYLKKKWGVERKEQKADLIFSVYFSRYCKFSIKSAVCGCSTLVHSYLKSSRAFQ